MARDRFIHENFVVRDLSLDYTLAWPTYPRHTIPLKTTPIHLK
jgi:hypothetical protein